MNRQPTNDMNPNFKFSLEQHRQSLRTAVLAAALLAGLPLLAATTVVQNFSYTTPWVADPSAPSLNETFNITKWGSRPEYNGDASLTAVTIDLLAELRYDGELISVLASQSYTLQVASDFTFLLDGNNLATGLDPLVTQSGTSPGSAYTPFGVGPVTDTETDSLAQAVGTFLGVGTIPLQVTGDLLATGPGGYHNLTDLGSSSPFVFLNNTKVFTMEQLQLFQLHTTIAVTYAVPEAGTGAALVAIGGIAAACWRRRRRAQSAR